MAYHGDSKTVVIPSGEEVRVRHGVGSYSYVARNQPTRAPDICYIGSYDGDWVNGQKHGHGRFSYAGYTYEGDFRHGEMTGRGTRTSHNDKVTYTGDFVQGEMHGRGKLVDTRSDISYDGGFRYNQREGDGSLTVRGDMFQGYFQANRKHGEGRYEWAGGSVYEGGWQNGRREGNGLEVCTEHAEGQENSNSEVRYVFHGHYHQDRRHGYGMLQMRDGPRYCGQFCRGAPAPGPGQLRVRVAVRAMVADTGRRGAQTPVSPAAVESTSAQPQPHGKSGGSNARRQPQRPSSLRRSCPLVLPELVALRAVTARLDCVGERLTALQERESAQENPRRKGKPSHHHETKLGPGWPGGKWCGISLQDYLRLGLEAAVRQLDPRAPPVEGGEAARGYAEIIDGVVLGITAARVSQSLDATWLQEYSQVCQRLYHTLLGAVKRRGMTHSTLLLSDACRHRPLNPDCDTLRCLPGRGLLAGVVGKQPNSSQSGRDIEPVSAGALPSSLPDSPVEQKEADEALEGAPSGDGVEGLGVQIPGLLGEDSGLSAVYELPADAGEDSGQPLPSPRGPSSLPSTLAGKPPPLTLGEDREPAGRPLEPGWAVQTLDVGPTLHLLQGEVVANSNQEPVNGGGGGAGKLVVWKPVVDLAAMIGDAAASSLLGTDGKEGGETDSVGTMKLSESVHSSVADEDDVVSALSEPVCSPKSSSRWTDLKSSVTHSPTSPVSPTSPRSPLYSERVRAREISVPVSARGLYVHVTSSSGVHVEGESGRTLSVSLLSTVAEPEENPSTAAPRNTRKPVPAPVLVQNPPMLLGWCTCHVPEFDQQDMLKTHPDHPQCQWVMQGQVPSALAAPSEPASATVVSPRASALSRRFGSMKVTPKDTKDTDLEEENAKEDSQAVVGVLGETPCTGQCTTKDFRCVEVRVTTTNGVAFLPGLAVAVIAPETNELPETKEGRGRSHTRRSSSTVRREKHTRGNATPQHASSSAAAGVVYMASMRVQDLTDCGTARRDEADSAGVAEKMPAREFQLQKLPDIELQLRVKPQEPASR